MALIRAAQNGPYSSSSTWVGGVVPTTGDTACSGPYRIQLDVDPIATVSAVVADYVAAGGSTPATNHAGGFTVPVGMHRILQDFRYGWFRTGAAAANAGADLVVINASLTIQGTVQFYNEGTTNDSTSHAIYVYTTNNTEQTINLSHVQVKSSATTSCYVLNMQATTDTSRFVLNVNGNVTPDTGVIARGRFLRATSSVPYSFVITVAGEVYAGAQFYISYNVLPVGAAAITFLNKNIHRGTGAISDTIYVVRFKHVTFEQGVYSDTALSNSYGVNLQNIATAVTLNGNLEVDGQSQASFNMANSPAVLTINGDVIRRTTLTSDTGQLLVLSGSTGDVVVNGMIKEYATAQTSNSATYTYALVYMPSGFTGNFTCNGVYAEGRSNVCLFVEHSTTLVNRTLTINGDVDARNTEIWTVTNVALVAFESTTNSYTLIVNGDVYAPLNGSSQATGATVDGVISVRGSPSYKRIQINGTVYGSLRALGVQLRGNNTTVTEGVYIRKIVGGAQFAATINSLPAVSSDYVTVIVDELDCGLTGRFPISANFKFRDAANAVLRARTESLAELLLLEQSGINIPAAADVKAGVSIGSTLGTLVVPAIDDVLAGVAYGNGLVGTLEVCGSGGGSAIDYTARFDTLDAVLGLVKAKTDQLAFTTGAVNAHVASGGGTVDLSPVLNDLAVIETKVDGIKVQTDEFTFTNNGVVSDATIDFSQVLNAISQNAGNVNQIKLKTDQLTFTLGRVDANVTGVTDYTPRFDALATAISTVTTKTNQLTFNAQGVVAGLDTSGLATALATSLQPNFITLRNDVITLDYNTGVSLTNVNNSLALLNSAQGQSATALNTLITSVDGLPAAINYTPRFNAVDAAVAHVESSVQEVLQALPDLALDVGDIAAGVDSVLSPRFAQISTKTNQLNFVAGGVVVATGYEQTYTTQNTPLTLVVTVLHTVTKAPVPNKRVTVTRGSTSMTLYTTPLGSAFFPVSMFDAISTGPSVVVEVDGVVHHTLSHPLSAADRRVTVWVS